MLASLLAHRKCTDVSQPVSVTAMREHQSVRARSRQLLSGSVTDAAPTRNSSATAFVPLQFTSAMCAITRADPPNNAKEWRLTPCRNGDSSQYRGTMCSTCSLSKISPQIQHHVTNVTRPRDRRYPRAPPQCTPQHRAPIRPSPSSLY